MEHQSRWSKAGDGTMVKDATVIQSISSTVAASTAWLGSSKHISFSLVQSTIEKDEM